MAKKPQRKMPARMNNPRQAPAMEIMDIPVLETGFSARKDRMWDRLSSGFWLNHPITGLEDLSEEELTDTLEWAQSVTVHLNKELEELDKVLKAEWLAKELLLDECIEVSIQSGELASNYNLD